MHWRLEPHQALSDRYCGRRGGEGIPTFSIAWKTPSLTIFRLFQASSVARTRFAILTRSSMVRLYNFTLSSIWVERFVICVCRSAIIFSQEAISSFKSEMQLAHCSADGL